LGEFGLIERIRKAAGRAGRGVQVGIGDDAAALAVAPGMTLLATTDMLLEGVHFDPATTDLGSLGWKSAAANLSDIAAMGGTPRFALIGLGLPARCRAEDVAAFTGGFLQAGRKHGLRLVGGDTCSSAGGLVISVTVLGEARRKEIVTRSGARPGDLIFVTGTPGDSGAGLELLRDASVSPRSAMDYLISRHLRPVPRVAWGRKIGTAGVASAMIDVSDGLSSDLGHLCDESGAGALIAADRVPLSRELRSVCLKRPALEYALNGGEDYELLFTVPPEKRKAFRALRVPATEIGVIVKGRGMRIVRQGRTERLLPGGYDHFRGGPA
jgi:thiamine-monophosphate kinase